MACAIEDALVLGQDRTRQQDVELDIRQLADIAIKALSTAINDPTTAMLFLDRLTEVLSRTGNWVGRETLAGRRGGIVVLSTPSFARFVEEAFTQVRRYGSGDPIAAAYLATALGRLAARTPAASLPPLREQAAALRHEAHSTLAVAADKGRVKTALAWTGAVKDDPGLAAPRALAGERDASG